MFSQPTLKGREILPSPSNLPDMERLVEQYGNTMLRMCCVYLGDEHLAADAVQDAYIKIYRAWRDFDSPAAEKAWVMRVVINVCKDYLRSAWKRRVSLVDEYPEIAAPQTNTDACDKQGRLYHEIQALKPKYKQVILLHYYEDLSVNEIARILNAPQSTISVRLRRAKAILQDRLEGIPHEDL